MAVEVDEYGHCDRDIEYEDERERKLKERLNCVFIRINPDEPNFSINRSRNEIHRHIKKSNKKLIKEKTKKSLMDKIARRLLKLEFQSSNSIKTRCSRYIVKKYFPQYKNMLTYCLKCNNNTKNIGLKKVTMTNKVIRAKSKWTTCLANKSRFFKQKHNKKSGW